MVKQETKMENAVNNAPKFLSAHEIDEWRLNCENSMREIHTDYFSDELYEDFKKRVCAADTGKIDKLVMRLVSLRAIKFTDIRPLVTKFETLIREKFPERAAERFYLHPSYNLRTMTRAAQDRDDQAALITHPHTDYSWSVFQYTSWTLLNDGESRDSGSIVFFDDFPFDALEANGFECRELYKSEQRVNLLAYWDDPITADKILKPHIVCTNMAPGDCVYWTNQTVHGATKPSVTDRMSFDFRLVPESSLRVSQPHVRNVFEFLAENFDFCAAMNLAVLGDTKGALRKFLALPNSMIRPDVAPLISLLTQSEPSSDVTSGAAEIRHEKEFSWIDTLVQSKPRSVRDRVKKLLFAADWALK